MGELNLKNEWLEGRPQMLWRTSLRVDLTSYTRAYLKYFDSWESYISKNDELMLRRTIRRYERFWLTLLHQHQDADHSEVFLEPPSDIHWIWHLHMLQPASYYVYCKQRFGRILPHRFSKSESEIQLNRLKTATAWRKAFPSEPFELDLDDAEDSWAYRLPTATRLDYLIDLAKREKHFQHRIAMAHFRDQSLLFSAESRYKQLLALKQTYDWEPRCLPSDVELVWRVHMLQPLQYIEDIKRFLNVDGSISPFTVQSFLTAGINYLENLSCLELMTFIAVSNQFWKSVYPVEDSSFFVDGTTPRSAEVKMMPCRGESTDSVLVAFKSKEYDGHAVDACDITFTNLSVEELWTKQKNFKVAVKLLGLNSFKQELIFESKGVIGQVINQPDKKFRVKDQQFLGKCRFDPKENRGIELQVFASQGFGCFVKYRLMTTKVFDPLQSVALNSCSQGMASISLGQNFLAESKKMFSSSDNVNRRQHIVIPKITCTDPKMTLNYKVEVSNRRPFQFVLDRNAGESTCLPKYLEFLLSGVINWQEALSDFDHENHFLVARHGLKCRDLGLAFGVEIVRNDSSNLFAVSLFHNNQHLVALAYSIDQHYLANSSQVLESCPLIFNPHRGDLAMAVRGHKDEELVIIAKWIEGINSENKIHLTTFDLRSRHAYTVQITEDEQHSFSNDVVTVELPSGRITASCSAGEVPRNIVWAFSIGCLYISIQRPSGSMMLKDCTSILSLPSGEGSIRSSSVQFSMDGSNDGSSIGRRHRKKASLQQYKQNKKQHKRRKMSASFTFLLACGFRLEMISPDNSLSKNSNLRVDHGSMVEVASFSYLGENKSPHPETRASRMSSRSCNVPPPPTTYFESRFNCDHVETSIFERV